MINSQTNFQSEIQSVTRRPFEGLLKIQKEQRFKIYQSLSVQRIGTYEALSSEALFDSSVGDVAQGEQGGAFGHSVSAIILGAGGRIVSMTGTFEQTVEATLDTDTVSVEDLIDFSHSLSALHTPYGPFHSVSVSDILSFSDESDNTVPLKTTARFAQTVAFNIALIRAVADAAKFRQTLHPMILRNGVPFDPDGFPDTVVEYKNYVEFENTTTFEKITLPRPSFGDTISYDYALKESRRTGFDNVEIPGRLNLRPKIIQLTLTFRVADIYYILDFENENHGQLIRYTDFRNQKWDGFMILQPAIQEKVDLNSITIIFNGVRVI